MHMPLVVGTYCFPDTSSLDSLVLRAGVHVYRNGVWTDITGDLNAMCVWNLAIFRGYLHAATDQGLWVWAEDDRWIPYPNTYGGWGAGVIVHDDRMFYVTQGHVQRYDNPGEVPAVEQIGSVGMSVINIIATNLSGQWEILCGATGTDYWEAYNIETCERMSVDSRGGSCCYDLFEHQGVIHSANEYGWCYRSFDGRFFGPVWEDVESEVISSSHDYKMWSLFRCNGELWGGTCSDGSVPCHLIKYDGNLWRTSPKSHAKSTSAYGQGYLRGIANTEGSGAYVATGIGSYEASFATPDESKVYWFDGVALQDISPPAPHSGYPNLRFAMGVQSMTMGDPRPWRGGGGAAPLRVRQRTDR